MLRKSPLIRIMFFSLFIAACASSANNNSQVDQPSLPEVQPQNNSQLAENSSNLDVNEVSENTAPSDGDEAAPFVRPEWQLIELTEASTGEVFSLASFEGKVVIVEAMAVWCPVCVTQQGHINEAVLGIDSDDLVVVSLDVDPTEDSQILSRHAQSLGLSWRFALAGNQVAALLQQEFGPQVLAPPSTPVIIIAPDGQFILTPFGIKDAKDLTNIVKFYLPEG